MTLTDDAEAVRAAVERARAGLVDREVLSDVVALCAVAREHLLVVGPPGTAKSEAVRLVARQLGGNYFEYLLGRFTEPNEVFGSVRSTCGDCATVWSRSRPLACSPRRTSPSSTRSFSGRPRSSTRSSAS